MGRWQIPLELPIAWAFSMLAIPFLFTDLVVVRLLVVIPFLLLAPGLLLTTALFPRAGEPTEVRATAEEESLPEDPEARHRQLTLSGWERLGAILGLSVTLLAIQGLVLGWTDIGISLATILASRILIDLGLSAWLISRWNRVERQHRFRLQDLAPERGVAKAGGLLIGLALIGVASALLIEIGDRGLEPTTAFSVSSTALMTHCLPETYNGTYGTSAEGCPDDISRLRFFIGNREFRDVDYVLDVFWSDSPDPEAPATGRVHVQEVPIAYVPDPQDIPTFVHVNVQLDAPPDAGLQYLHGVLLLEGDPEPYRTVSLPIVV